MITICPIASSFARQIQTLTFGEDGGDRPRYKATTASKAIRGAILLLLGAQPVLQAQNAATTAKAPAAGAQVERAAAGDMPAEAGPLATNLSPALDLKAINAAMRRVSDWQLRTRLGDFNRQWTYAALYDGLLAESAATGDPAGHDAVLAAAERWQWQMEESRFPHADDEAIGQAYLDLYAEHPAADRIAGTRRVMDRLVERPDDPNKPVWWWCDALFMAPPVLAHLSAITGDRRYVAYMDREWAVTRKLLYSPAEHLYLRDDRFLDTAKMHEANGKPIFWSRGNGWVVAGLVNLLEYLPKDDPSRAGYETQYREMLTRIAALQPKDGLWRAGLLDADAYTMPEVSGSAFFTYAMAYGVRTGLLDRATFLPVIQRSWAAMVGRIYEDGRLGSIQPIGFAPDAFSATSSYVYGVGGFLLAGAELERMLRSPGQAPAHKPRHGKSAPSGR